MVSDVNLHPYTMYDEMGNVNNVLEVQEYVPEILGEAVQARP